MLNLVATLTNDFEKSVKRTLALQRKWQEVLTQIQASQSGKESVVTKERRIYAEMQEKQDKKNNRKNKIK
mgnify:CR=1 FL=1